jgi:hypothetical protein
MFMIIALEIYYIVFSRVVTFRWRRPPDDDCDKALNAHVSACVLSDRCGHLSRMFDVCFRGIKL